MTQEFSRQLRLTRVVRLAICDPKRIYRIDLGSELVSGTRERSRPSDPASPRETPRNGLVAIGASSALSPIVELGVTCAGRPGPSGYLIDITEIDRACRDVAAPILRSAIKREICDGVAVDPREVLDALERALSGVLSAPLAAISYRTSPYRSATLEASPNERGASSANASGTETPMTASTASSISTSATVAPHRFILCETFEFAASHRLHLADETAEANRRLFGKCNNPNGHGHNYRIEVAVEVPSGDGAARTQPLDFSAVESVVDREIMARFDHKHLNLDCPEFATLNPSVEHIAMVCHDLLAPRFAELGGRLRSVEVWETGKTSCRYPA